MAEVIVEEYGLELKAAPVKILLKPAMIVG